MTIKPTRWWWPPDRKRARVLRAMIERGLIDERKIIDQTMEAMKDWYMYGIEPQLDKYKETK